MKDEKKAASQEISDEALDQVAGGGGRRPNGGCPGCGSLKPGIRKGNDCVCPDCGYLFFTKAAHVNV